MKTIKSRLGKAIAVFKNENKFKYGYRVKVVKNNGLKKYDKYIGKVGIYDGLEYWNKEKPFRVDFLDGTGLCFSEDELEKVDR